MTANVWPPIVRLAVRAVVDVFPDALNPTVVDPVPLAADVTVSHDALLLAVHAQLAGAVRPTEPVPPVAGTACDAADNV